MAYLSFPFPSFADGLNLRDKADAVGEAEAIDCLNVLFTERGAVKQRDGYDEFTISPLTNNADSLEPHYESDGTRQLLAGCGTRLEVIDTGGAIAASDTGLTTGIWDFARFGGPTAEVSYAVNGTNAARKWDGSTWAAAAAVGKPRYIAVQGAEDGGRMIAGGYDSGANGPTGAADVNPSRIHFSDPGAPETWTANNYVDLTPGDGEKVQGIVAYKDAVFVFKETKFFRFYGESSDADGNPIFAYTAIEANTGLASPRALAYDETGIYFLDRHGIFRTTGGEPEELSDVIGPIFWGSPSSFYQGGALLHSLITNAAMWMHDGLLYCAFTRAGTTNDRVLVYDPVYEWWSLYDFPAACGTSFRIGSQRELVFGGAVVKNIYRHSDSYANDAGEAITSRWRSGWFDHGSPDVKRIRETKVWGTGIASLGTAVDYGEAAQTTLVDFGQDFADTWGDGSGGDVWGGGSDPAEVWSGGISNAMLEPKLARIACRGTVFSAKFTNNTLDQHWAVHRLDNHVAETRITSTRQVDAAAAA